MYNFQTITIIIIINVQVEVKVKFEIVDVVIIFCDILYIVKNYQCVFIAIMYS